MQYFDVRLHRLLPILMSGNGNSAYCYEMKMMKRLYPEIKEIGETMNRSQTLLGGWDFTVVVASKFPLPNYRPDLDDKRSQWEAVIPLSLQRRVEGLLQEHLDRMQLSSRKVSESDGTNSIEDVNLEENPDSFLHSSVMEKVLQISLRICDMPRAWQA
ncbi:hypothetical protein SLEP1_g17405 [Rubroshorea leprosula]|uniref:Uncharacterized protein n=1 Tax=Rubroshorea leprosula TaxID=152421 RepID=A0AAV5J394_9ROSI|nr:hypothetical protein SLEP1_g17405 [Rubroshorea leprosula]